MKRKAPEEKDPEKKKAVVSLSIRPHPFWSPLTLKESKRVLSCAKTDCRPTTNIKTGSWFSVRKTEIDKGSLSNLTKRPFGKEPCLDPPKVKKKRVSRPKKQCLGPEEKERVKKPPAESCRKIRVYPTPAQKEVLMEWFGCARWTYNRTVELIREGTVRDKGKLRAICVNNDNFEGKPGMEWVLKTPHPVRDAAMIDVLKAYDSNFAKETGKPFEIKFRSKKQPQESIEIRATSWTKAGVFFPKSFGEDPLWSSEPLPEKLRYDSRLIKTRLGEFYLCIPHPNVVELGVKAIPLYPETMLGEFYEIVERKKVLSIDPGVRTFATCYDSDGAVFEWGKGDIERINRLCYHLDRLQAKWSAKEVRHKKRYAYKKAGMRLRKRIRNLVDEFHKKMAKWVVDGYDEVLIPKFESQGMVSTKKPRKRVIGSKTARSLMTWSHYRFQRRLIDRARRRPACRIEICDEHFTSKTCGQCGHLHDSLKGNKTFSCPKCKMESDRDFNASRNILLRYLTLHPRTKVSPSGVGDLALS